MYSKNCGLTEYSQRLCGHHSLREPIKSPTVGEDHQLAEMGARHLLLSVLCCTVDGCVLRHRLLEDTNTACSSYSLPFVSLEWSTKWLNVCGVCIGYNTCINTKWLVTISVVSVQEHRPTVTFPAEQTKCRCKHDLKSKINLVELGYIQSTHTHTQKFCWQNTEPQAFIFHLIYSSSPPETQPCLHF